MKIDFHGKKIDFWRSVVNSKKFNISSYEILSQAYDQGLLIDERKKILFKFIEFLKLHEKYSTSQLYQDIFATFVVNDNFTKTFLEFGATDGKNLSNSYMLENNLLWTGVIAEPDSRWFNSLKENRPKTNILYKCIWNISGEKLSFFSSKQSELSTLENFKENDVESMPANTKLRIKEGRSTIVESISLNDVVDIEFKNNCPSYISIDTEGSEFEILKSFDFNKYRPVVLTVEHNFTKLQKKIDQLMSENNFIRIFRNLTVFDAWYVAKEALDKMEN